MSIIDKENRIYEQQEIQCLITQAQIELLEEISQKIQRLEYSRTYSQDKIIVWNNCSLMCLSVVFDKLSKLYEAKLKELKGQ